jgi:glycosyltransferase involved in cell wall biosynthesis
LTNPAIGFDCRYINPDSLDGIGRFTIELFRATSEKLEITAIISDLRQLEFLPSGTKYVKLNSPTSMLEPLASLRLNAHKFETVYSPMQTIGSFGKEFRLILTIHDLIYYSHPTPPNNFNPLIRFGWWLYHKSFIPQRLLLNAADEVVTISNSTKKLITENKLTKKRITVVSNAAKQLTVKPLPVEKKIVYMGSFMPYKNVEELIYGASQLNGFRLVLLSGRASWSCY